jgi:hypothetical protein
VSHGGRGPRWTKEKNESERRSHKNGDKVEGIKHEQDHRQRKKGNQQKKGGAENKEQDRQEEANQNIAERGHIALTHTATQPHRSST